MVKLSLMHRVKMDKASASYSNEPGAQGRRRLISLSTAVAILNVIFLAAGATIAATIDQGTYSGEPNKPWVHLHKEGTIVVNRTTLVFFWCLLPFILSILGIVEAILYRRNKTSLPLVLALSASSVGLLLWVMQFGIESSCLHGGDGFRHIRREAGWCGFELRQWDPRSFWQSGLALAWFLSWCGVAMLALYLVKLVLTVYFFVQQRKGGDDRRLRMLQRSYSYHSPSEEREMQMTNRDIPDRSGTNTPLPPQESDRLVGTNRPPSLRDQSMFHEELSLTQHVDPPEEKEHEMV